ncbi:MAG: outer membrane protein assembly factor BamA [Deltaproteobacteria bacterium]|nr:outer membrane protein assembly factor BamA [Candidatus Anaeroferrophillus wilburensis]MBN2889748.1 outer membrane protein assembly factor BamA [Deltaproteobacteria bacterium]
MIRRSLLFTCVSLFCFFAFLLIPGVTGAADVDYNGLVVADVVVLGNQKVAKNTILDKMKTRPGEQFSDAQLDADLKVIYALGFFDNIIMNLKPVNGRVEVAVVVVEKPSVASIDINGNRKIKRKDLLKEITVRTFAILSQERISESEEKIRTFYHDKGFYSVTVRSKTVAAGKNRVKVVFTINEGRKSYIKKIRFNGNDAFSDWRLRREIQTKTYSFFLTWATDSGILKQEMLDQDVRMLKSYYLSKGYVQAKISKPKITLSDNKKWIYLDFDVEEGKIFTLGAIDIDDADLAQEMKEKILKVLKGKQGEVFSNLNLHDDIETLTTYYADQGYAFVDVNPLTKVDGESRKVDITYAIDRGKQFRFGRIEINGNDKTRDKVIRRELRFAEGELFSSSRLKRSRERLTNTQFFSEADIKTEPADNDLMDVEVSVIEGQTGSFSVGLGYSTVDSIIGMAGITKKNFLGKGWDMAFNMEIAGSRSRYSISLTDPYFLDIPLQAGFSIYNEEIEYDAYDTKQQGMSVHFGKPIDEYTSWSAGYRWEKVDIFNINYYASDYIRDEEGKTTTSQVFLSLIRDKRDNYFFPRRGYRLKGTAVLAGGPLGFDNQYYKFILEAHKFFPLHWDSALHLRSILGYADGYGGEDLPLYERFYVGGMNSVRGFDFGEAGPEDRLGDVIGGTKELILGVEWIFPLVKSMGLNGLIFYDAGKAYDDNEMYDFDLRHSVGFGIRWKSPMGPLRIEWGFNLSPEDDEKDHVWDFSVGAFF